jgi:DNA repair exonuclease SbcCD ATPase subunit
MDFVSGINLIVGSSDAGKSAILRAINFVFHNNLKGDSFIRHGSSECRVTIKFSDGVEVTRIKGGDVNSYTLTDLEGDKHTFAKIGTSVPDEIKKHLGQPPLDDKKRPISYADQMSNLFLVDLSSTDLPRTLSELTGIQNLQTAAETLSKNARSFDRIIKDKTDKITKLENDLEEYSYVAKDLEAIEEIEAQLTKINSKIEKTNKARQFIITNNKIAQEAKSIKIKIEKDKKLSELQSRFNIVQETNDKLKLSKRILKDYKAVADSFNKLKKEIKNLQVFACQSNKDKLAELNNLIIRKNRAESYQKSFEQNKSDTDDVENLISDENNTIKINKDELERLINQLKAQGNWCETCNRPLV